MHAVGIDIIEISRIAQTVERWGDRFLRRIYTEAEIVYCRGRAPQLASRFAAKEAMMKALGTGIRGVGWKDIEVVRARGGPPSIRLTGRAARIAERQGVKHSALSLSHSREYAVASIVLERQDLL
ncbi:MAG: holo-ACP synthase [Chloroflexi bacterium]|nr:holo-ACP synthase [Chloroflexota bacterium]